MKKIIESISILLLACFSFFYTDKVINIINKKDPLMVDIINNKVTYDILPVNALLNEDTIIPGINGKEVDVNKSYENMKSGGIFREEALIFKDLYPTKSIHNNKNKYIIKGNSAKKEVSLLIIFKDNYIDKIKEIENITVFINHNELTITNINKLKGKEVYSYGNKGVYNQEILINDNTLINRLSNNKSNYCLAKEKDDELLNTCNKNNMHVVLPTIIGGYYEIKNNISNGSIIQLESLNDIEIIVNYIKSKGYDIVSLSKLLSE